MQPARVIDAARRVRVVGEANENRREVSFARGMEVVLGMNWYYAR